MYNHARTLLVNLTGSSSTFDNVPGDEAISTQYSQLQLPTYLNTIRSRLFGASPDRAMLNYRTAQLLTMIECTELQSHILALDPRLTYSSFDLYDNDLFSPHVHRYAGTNDLTLVGKASSPDISGVSGYDFRVEVSANNVTVKRVTWPTSETTTAIVITDSLSQQIKLPYSDYNIYVRNTNSASWVIRGYLRPTLSLQDIEQNLRNIGEPNLLQLFGVKDEEPYKTFKACWEIHPDLSYRLGGLILALIYRTEELRNG